MTKNDQLAREVNQLEAWSVRNAERVRLLTGSILIANGSVGAWVALDIQTAIVSAISATAGILLLGGIPAMLRLIRHPRMQLRHWFDVLLDNRRYETQELPDGSIYTVEMRPKLRDGWYWVSTRRWKNDE